MNDRKPFMGLRGDQPFTYTDDGKLLVWDDDLGLCAVDEDLPLSEQFLEPVDG